MSEKSEPFCIFGHRGAAGEVLENTLEGFERAIALGVDAIELDIQENSSELWVFHDQNLDRLSDATGSFVTHPDPAAIRLRDGSSIPTLKQVLDAAWGKVPVNIEIKAVKNLGLLLDLLGRYRPAAHTADNGLPWILISSFDHPALMQLHQRATPWPLAPLLGHKPTRSQLDAIRQDFPPFSWHFYDEHLDFYQITKLREQGEPSFVYTVNDLERARELRRRGVAGIFTDLPSAMLALRDD